VPTVPPGTLRINGKYLHYRPAGWQRPLDRQGRFLDLEYTFSQPPGTYALSSPRVVAGDFDGDAASVEVVFGTAGCEFGSGLFHMFRFELDAGGQVLVSMPVPLPAPPVVSAASGTMEEWQLETWYDDAVARPALLVARSFDAGGRHTIHTHVLRQEGAGGFGGNQWTELAPPPPATPAGLFAAYTLDLDAALANGRRGSDLLLLTQTSTPVQGSTLETLTLDAWLSATRADGSQVWRRVMKDVAAPVDRSGSPGRIETARLVDVNGDQHPDLLVREELRRDDDLNALQDPTWRYFSSAFSGVAGGLTSLPETAGGFAYGCRRPTLLDADGDGLFDIATAGALHLGKADGEYERTSLPGFPGTRQSSFVAQAILDPAGAVVAGRALDLLVFDPTDAVHDVVVELKRNGPRNVVLARSIPCHFGAGIPRSVVPWQATRAGAAKDLAVLLDTSGMHKVRRARYDGNAFELLPGDLSEIEVEPSVGLAVLRREPLLPGERALANARRQDLVARAKLDSSQLLVFQVVDDDVVRVTPVRAPGPVIGLGAASVSGDALEDLVLLFADQAGMEFTVTAWVQHPDATRGIVQPDAEVNLLHFASPFERQGVKQAARVRGFHFDATTVGGAEGVLVLTEDGGQRSEIRFVQPFLEGGHLSARMVRSPLLGAIVDPLELTSIDSDGDGQADTVAGAASGSGGLTRVDRGFRR